MPFPQRHVRLSVAVLGLTLLVEGIGGESQAQSGNRLISSRLPLEGKRTELRNGADFRFSYTGKLFGYFQLGAGDEFTANEPVKDFLQTRVQSQLLVGVGDNFGPEFESSIQPDDEDTCIIRPRAPKKGPELQLPEKLYKADDRFPNQDEVYCDNVARFLLRAGYRALVPGREDFIYSATWLRAMALGLQWASLPDNAAPLKSDNVDGRLYLLAANLRQKGNGNKCPLLFAPRTDAAQGNHGAETDHVFPVPERRSASPVPETACTPDDHPRTESMDWLDRLDLTLDPDTGIAANIEKATALLPAKKSGVHNTSALEIRRSVLENQAKQIVVMVNGVTGETMPEHLKSLADAVATLGIDQSYQAKKGAGNQEVLTLTSTGIKALQEMARVLQERKCSTAPEDDLLHPQQAGSDLCRVTTELVKAFKAIETGPNLLWSEGALEAGRRLLLRTIAQEEENVGYTIYHDGSIEGARQEPNNTLIIGIVGEEVLRPVSSANLAVCEPYTEEKAPRAGPMANDRNPQQRAGREPCATENARKVTAFDPLPTLLAVLRAAKQRSFDTQAPEDQFSRVIVLAQMSRGETEELGAQLHSALEAHFNPYGNLDPAGTAGPLGGGQSDPSLMNPVTTPLLLISEGQSNQFSPHLNLTYTRGSTFPVLTPAPPYDGRGLLRSPLSEGQIDVRGEDAELSNTPPTMPAKNLNPSADTTLELLLDRMASLGIPIPGNCTDTEFLKKPPERRACERDVTAQLLQALRSGQGSLGKGDVVLLEARDLFFGHLPNGYADYKACGTQNLTSERDKECELRVALDRVFWQGEYQERVMVTGSDLVSMLTTSQAQSLEDGSLAPADALGQSLTSFGVVQPLSRNLSRPGLGLLGFPITQDKVCGLAKSTTTKPVQYCVNGQPIGSDTPYWVITSDRLAQDAVLYKVMQKTLKDGYHEQTKTFLTEAIADSLVRVSKASLAGHQKSDRVMGAPSYSPGIEPPVEEAEWKYQLRDLLHLDVGKLVAGFSARRPDGGNIYAENFQGASDTRASTPTQQELDLEGASRLLFDVPPAKHLFTNEQLSTALGVQADAEYDRAVTGNLTNKPATVVYALNSFTVGPFVQFRLPPLTHLMSLRNWPESYGRVLPRTLLVLAPFQYQRQMTGNFLFFPFSASPPHTVPPTVSQQYTLHVPKTYSLSEKAGIRQEFATKRWFLPDVGSYTEAGFQAGTQSNILSSIQLQSDGVVPPPCNADSQTTIALCFAQYVANKTFQIDSTTTLAEPVGTRTLRVEGAYWDIHLVKAINLKGSQGNPGGKVGAKGDLNLSIDSKADWFSPRSAGKSLNTQTHYAVPLSASLNFPVLRNFSMSPTFTSFWYSSQVTGQHIQINTFLITAKWFYGRDTSVPPPRQLFFRGPASIDQTSSSKMK